MQRMILRGAHWVAAIGEPRNAWQLMFSFCRTVQTALPLYSTWWICL